jgi:hypothetical protein
MELLETESVTEGDTDTSKNPSPEDQVRMLRMRLRDSLKALEWSELLKAASMDENLVYQLAKGGRRTAAEIERQKLSNVVLQQQSQNDASQKAPLPES